MRNSITVSNIVIYRITYFSNVENKINCGESFPCARKYMRAKHSQIISDTKKLWLIQNFFVYYIKKDRFILKMSFVIFF